MKWTRRLALVWVLVGGLGCKADGQFYCMATDGDSDGYYAVSSNFTVDNDCKIVDSKRAPKVEELKRGGYLPFDSALVDALRENPADPGLIDCDDGKSWVYPDASESICAEKSSDCDPSTEPDDDQMDVYPDADGDEYPAEGEAQRACTVSDGYVQKREDGLWDCDDDPSDDTANDAADIHPGAEDPICGDDLDQDCDGLDTCALDGDKDADTLAIWFGDGTVVAAAGYLDGDTFSDAAIGDPENNSVTLLFGGAEAQSVSKVGLDVDDLALVSGDAFGTSIVVVPDGLAIGAPDSNGGMGGVTVISGLGQDGTWDRFGTIVGDDPYAVIGRSMFFETEEGTLGVAYDFNNGSATASAVSVFDTLPPSGGKTADSDKSFSLTGYDLQEAERPLAFATGGLSGCDGAIAVGAPADNAGKGGAYVYCTPDSTRTLASADFKLSGSVSNDDLGAAISFLPDQSAASSWAFAVGAPGVGSDAGAVYLFTNLAKVDDDPDLALDDATTKLSGDDDDKLGAAISQGCNLNGDGDPDFAVGAPGADRVDIYLGPPSNPTKLGSVSGPTGFGRAIACAGDLNGDGFDDLLVASDTTAYLLPGGFAAVPADSGDTAR